VLSGENIDEKEAKTEMRIRSIAMTGAGLLCVGAALAEVGKTEIRGDRVSVFKVPLECPAASHIGLRQPRQTNTVGLRARRDYNCCLAESDRNLNGNCVAVRDPEEGAARYLQTGEQT
jgi:hypothetical protein